MTTAKFAGRGGTMTTIAPHATGHERAKYGTLLRIEANAASVGSPRATT